MKRRLLPLALLLCCGICAETLPTREDLWSDSWGFHWTFSENGMTNVGAVGQQIFKSAPHSRMYELEAEVTPHRRLGTDWGSSGIVLGLDGRNFWYLGLVQAPDHMKRNTCLEMQECNAGRWAYEKNYKRGKVFNEWFIWEYGKTYRLRLRLENDVLTGSVELPDGQLVFQKVYELATPEATRLVRPAVTGSKLLMTFSNIKAIHGTPESAPVQQVAEKHVPPYQCKSYVPDIQEPATGYFHVKQLADGRWWAIDPLGRGFVPFGIDHCGYGGHFCEKLGYSPYGRHNDQTYKSQEEWAVETIGRMEDWGFNMQTASVHNILKYRGLAQAGNISAGQSMASLGGDYAITRPNGMPGSAFPNVFHPLFREFCRYRIQKYVGKDTENPWVFGYFTDNELNWWGGGNPRTGLFNAVMKNPPEHSAKQALIKLLLEQSQGSLDTFNRQWGLNLKSLDEISQLATLPENTDEQIQFKSAFTALVAETYFGVISEEFRRYDSHHMLLGCRFAGIYNHADAVWRAAGRYCDVVSFNFYGNVDLNNHRVTDYWPHGKTLAEAIAVPQALCGKPMMMTEWSFPALDSGLPCTIGAGQRFRTQKERAEATEIYAKTLLSLPYMIGYDYFMWVDQPALGSAGGQIENSNYGLVNKDGIPYAEVVAAFKAIQRNGGAWRRSPPPPEKPYRIRAVGQLYEDYRQALPQLAEWIGRKGVFTYERKEDGSFQLGNGKLALSSDGKSALLAVSLDGKRQGFFNMMLSHYNEKGRLTWTNATLLTSCTLKGDERQAVLEMHVRKPEITQEAKADAVSTMQFEMAYRIVLRPHDDYFLVDCISIHNPMPSTFLRMSQVFFRLYPDYEIHENPPMMVFNLWKADERAYWLGKNDDQPYMGVCAMEYQHLLLRFWTGTTSADQHPDAFRSVGGILRHGETWQTPDHPLYLFCYFGHGDEARAKAHAESIRQCDLGNP